MSDELELELPEDEPSEVEDEEQPVDQAQAEEERSAEEALGPPQFNYNDRLYAFGFSTSGKSEILNLIFSGIRCKKLLIDTKPEFHIPGVTAAHQPEDIDWREPVMHYQPIPGSDCSQYEPIFQAALELPDPLLVCVQEIQDLVDYKPQKAGRFLLGYAAKGARLKKGLLAASQRPRLVPTSAMTEAGHVIVMVPQLARRDDNVTAAEQISPVDGRPLHVTELERELAALQEEHGKYSFLWKDRHTGQLIAFPPIPQTLRDRSIVKRLEDSEAQAEGEG